MTFSRSSRSWGSVGRKASGLAKAAELSLPKLFEKALRLSDAGRNDKALLVYQKITKSFPECPEAWLNLGICHAADGSEEAQVKALEAFDEALNLNDAYHDAHYNKALVLDEMGFTSEARICMDLSTNSLLRLYYTLRSLYSYVLGTSCGIEHATGIASESSYEENTMKSKLTPTDSLLQNSKQDVYICI